MSASNCVNLGSRSNGAFMTDSLVDPVRWSRAIRKPKDAYLHQNSIDQIMQLIDCLRQTCLRHFVSITINIDLSQCCLREKGLATLWPI
jgi:hypothetical protein